MSDPVVSRELVKDDGIHRWTRIYYESGLVVDEVINIAAENEAIRYLSRQLGKDRDRARKL